MEKNLIKILKILKTKKKKVVLCHGVFDLVHLGHIEHFKSAKSHGDYLIVSLTLSLFSSVISTLGNCNVTLEIEIGVVTSSAF